MDSNTSQQHDLWIWKTHAFPKIEFFLWPCFQGRIATRELLWKKRHHRVAFLSSLPRQYWTLIHILRDGKVARDVWNAIHIPTTIENFWVLTVNDWLRLNCQSKGMSYLRAVPWSMVFPVVCWILWNHRKNVVFNSTTTPILNLLGRSIGYNPLSYGRRPPELCVKMYQSPEV